MPKASDHQSSLYTKALLIGDSGGGKTGALASLVFAGYRLFIIDYDNGLDYLIKLVKQKDPKLLDLIEYETCTDQMGLVGGKLMPKTADAWNDGIRALEKFYKVGLGEKDVLVIDTLTFGMASALRYVCKINARGAGRPQLQDWGAAQDMGENLVAMVTGDDFATNVLVSAHVTYIGDPENGEPTRGYPATLGKALSPKIGRYFNSTLLFRSQGTGAAEARRMYTGTYGNIDLKAASPAVKKDYPIQTALADYFQDVRK